MCTVPVDMLHSACHMFSGKPATMSSQLGCSYGFCFNASKAVDGVYVPTGSQHEFTSIAHTNQEVNSYLQIDLEANHCISAVKVWNRITHSKWYFF